MHKILFGKAIWPTFLLSALAFLPTTTQATILSEDSGKAVILSYHRIGEDAYPEASLRIEQLQAQMEELKRNDYSLISLRDLLTAINNNTALPPKTVALTFKAYRSTYENALPYLIEKKIPFTLFYDPEKISDEALEYMNRAELKALASYPFFTAGVSLPPALDIRDEKLTLKTLNSARQVHRELFGSEVAFLSYPFGEYNNKLKELAKTQGFEAAFTLNSGVAYRGMDMFAIPRFSMTEEYSDLERFRMITNSLPLPVSDIEPSDPQINGDQFHFGFTLPEKLETQSNYLSCFLSGHGKVEHEKLGNRIEIRTERPTDDTRIRLNCTIPEKSDNSESESWRWFGQLFYVPQDPIEDETINPQQDEPL